MDEWYGVKLNEHGCVISLDLRRKIFNPTIMDWVWVGINLAGSLPPEISQLEELRKLIFVHGRFTHFPEEIYELTNLDTLAFDRCTFQNATLSSGIGNLINLQFLSFNAVVGLSGPIPVEISRLSRLKYLRLRADFTGGIPIAITGLRYLTVLEIFNNIKLGGTIPVEIARMLSLKTLGLSNNGLVGSIPPQLGDLSNL